MPPLDEQLQTLKQPFAEGESKQEPLNLLYQRKAHTEASSKYKSAKAEIEEIVLNCKL